MPWSDPIPEGKLCQHCNRRPATEVYAENLSEAVHGAYEHWCDVCTLTEQVSRARVVAEKLPDLERQLAEAEAANP